jgi:hypothetical protein
MTKSTKMQWLKDRMNFAGDECLIWPFSRNNGYGNFAIRGAQVYAHRAMCELVNGKAPPDKPQVRHLCGRRECVNPRHLTWGSRSENMLDRRHHGTANTWGSNGKLTLAECEEIRALKDYLTSPEIAMMFGVTPSTVRNIQLGHWGLVEGRKRERTANIGNLRKIA